MLSNDLVVRGDGLRKMKLEKHDPRIADGIIEWVS